MDDMQKDFSPAADADSIDDMADDMIEMTDEEGNTTLFKILDYFFYNGDEYAILTDSIDEDTTGADRVDCYVMKIVPTTDESGRVGRVRSRGGSEAGSQTDGNCHIEAQ